MEGDGSLIGAYSDPSKNRSSGTLIFRHQIFRRPLLSLKSHVFSFQFNFSHIDDFNIVNW